MSQADKNRPLELILMSRGVFFVSNHGDEAVDPWRDGSGGRMICHPLLRESQKTPISTTCIGRMPADTRQYMKSFRTKDSTALLLLMIAVLILLEGIN
jgi:hypothetical protein